MPNDTILYWRTAAGDYRVLCYGCEPPAEWREPSKLTALGAACGHRRRAHLSLITVREVRKGELKA